MSFYHLLADLIYYGDKLRRKSWPEGHYIFLLKEAKEIRYDEGGVLLSREYIASSEDLLAEDWMYAK